MANDEYNTTGGEFNKPIGEMNSGLEAKEYYPVKETAANGPEFLASNEDSASNQSDNGSSQQSAVDKYNETKSNLDNLNQARNTADGVKSPDLNLANASEAEAEAAVAEASTAASVSVTSTVASLAGSVTVIAAAAAAVVSVAGGVLEKEPTILSEDYEVGTNYIKYEINLSELSENMDYKIKVSKPGFEIEYPILEEGLQRQIVPDLLPYRKYTLELIGVSPELGDIVYHTVECYTDILRMPKAVFQFTPHFDYILGRIDLEYETYISDFYNNSSNTYLQIYSGEKLILEDKTLPDDNFFRGTIHNLSSTSPIKAVAYTDWFNGLFTTENVEIGVYGYDIPIPDDFELKNLFMGSYTFGEECFYKTFDIENGTNLRIDTNFESDDEKESYRIDIYNHDEIIKSVESNEKTVDINLDTYVTNVDLKFTPLRIDGDDIKEFEPTIIKNYDVNPKIFEYANFYQYEGGYYFESLVSDDFVEKLSEKPLKMKVVRNFKDGTKAETAEELSFEEARISFEGSISDDQEKMLSDLSSFDVEITYGDTIITKFNSPTLSDLSLSSADVDDDGNIIIPFEMSGIEALNDLKIRAMIAEEEYDSILEGNKGKIVASELNNNIVNVSMEVSHYSDGVTLISNLYVDDYDLGADYEVSYFVSHSGSFYTSFDIKYDASINGKNANINLYPVVYDKDKNEINYDGKYLDYYRFRYSESNDTVYFTIGNSGFTDIEHEIPIDVNAPTNIVNLNYFDLGYYDDESYEVYATYEKTYNADGTVNYIFDAPFSDPSDTHLVRIEGSYVVDGVEKYICSDFLTSDFKLTNIPDYEYNFVLRAYYKNGDILYDTTIHNWTDSCSLRDYKEAIINKSTYIGALESSGNNPTLDRVIDLKLYTKNIDTSKGLTISYGGKDYQIVLDHNESDYVVSETDDDIKKRYNEIKTDYGYTIIYYNENENSYDKLKVELFIINGGKQDLDLNATATYYVSNGSESSKQEVKLINNTISYDKENLTYEYSSDEYYHIFNFNTTVNKTDDRDDVKVVAYSNGREIGSSSLSEREFRIDKGYSDVTLKLQEVKRQYCDSINYNSHQDADYIIFKEIELEKPELEAPASIINSINVENPDYGDEYIINVNADDFTDCSLSLYINYIDEDGNPYSDHVYGDNGSTSVSFTKHEDYTIKSVEVQVLKNWFTVNTFMVPLSVSLGETTVDEEITVPYSIDLPEGASLTSNAEYRVDGNSNSITSASGVLTIPSIEYKTEQIGFTLEYEYNGVTVYIPLRQDYTFEVEYDYDYEISTYNSSSYIFKTIETDNGNVYIDLDDDIGEIGYYVYKTNVTIKPKIGDLYLSNFNDYDVNVINAGYETYDGYQYRGSASVKADEQTLNGNEFKEHGSFLMYHEITVNSDNQLESIDKCVFEFEIDGKTYKIEYVPETIKKMSDVMSVVSSETINNSITKANDKLSISFDTGFDKEANPNYAYKVFIEDDNNQKLYESDYLDSSQVTIDDIEDTVIKMYIRLYYYDGNRYVELYNNENDVGKLNSVLYETTSISSYTSGQTNISNGFIRFYKEMLEEDSQLTIVIDKGRGTEQELIVSVNDFDKENSYNQSLQNDVTVNINYYGSGVYQIETTSTSSLYTVELTVTDKYGNEQIFTIERN